ncbi:glycerophosphodiester phosphodiesterase [Phytoactinopolyspora halotolerans]|uniref:Glycerophosphodiester phosphodiesterase n=1 Tax=Phytoactinopolyspora halotolerans TaxID=1981512 RepID=A0A6L9S6Z0_9ACTN|nr:glycerophosphodiester phosphodiesterase [Phytoactinopolyspora halotolerans]NEE00743.1 glycerophosphodiester phosphodiesterase [Phytoactinopolyspora halotolerans]
MTQSEGHVVLTLIGHRGTPFEFTENTVASLKNAESLGADGIEFDVRLTRDSVPVLLHDADLRRLWGRPQLLSEIDYHEVSDFLPTLDEAVRATSTMLVVDCKGAGTARRAISVLRDEDALHRCVFVGPHDILGEVRAQMPEARLALSWPGISTPPPETLEMLRPEMMNLHWHDLEQSSLDWYLRMGFSTWWTYPVDDPASLRRASELGFSGVISNDLPAISAAITTMEEAG